MTEVARGNLKFNKWSKKRIAEGRKICTSRSRRYHGDDRVAWISPKLPFWFIRNYLWVPEGADSPEELQRVVDKIFMKRVPGDREFYVHFGLFKDVGVVDVPWEVEGCD